MSRALHGFSNTSIANAGSGRNICHPSGDEILHSPSMQEAQEQEQELY